jgi:hypothetical protein
MIRAVAGGGRHELAASRLGWPRQTLSRYHTGHTLPPDDKVTQVATHLHLRGTMQVDLFALLASAREARKARQQGRNITPLVDQYPPTTESAEDDAAGPAPDPVDSPLQQAASQDAPPQTAVGRRRRNRLIVALAAAVVVIAAGVLVWRPWVTAGPVGIRGSYPGMGVLAIPIPVASLSPPLAAVFDHGRTAGAKTIFGYEFRSARDAHLCLTAAGSTPKAAHDGDRVELATCARATNQIWIPEQWEISRTRYTHLVSDRYQSMCLNADNRHGLTKGRRTQLWACYPANNESWSFADWYHVVQPGSHSYPLCLHTDLLCLDADRYSFGEGVQVNIWNQYAAPQQFWS